MKKIVLSLLIVSSLLGANIFTGNLLELSVIKEVSAASIKLNATSLTLKNVRKYQLKVKNTQKKVKWSSSDKRIATVDSKGMVSAKKNGTCTIYAKVSGKTLKCKVTVKSPTKKAKNPTSVQLNKKTLTLNCKATYTLKATLSPSNVVNKELKWSSSDSSIASVSSNGKLTAKKVGVATITVKTKNNKKATCKVTVKKPSSPYTSLKTISKLKAAKTNNKIIVVSTTSMNTRKCYFQYFEKTDGKWTEKIHTTGVAGKNGYGKKKWGDKKTPIGIFKFTKLFGIKDNPGTILPYTKLTNDMYWCGEYRYNQFVDDKKDINHKKKCSHNDDEHLKKYSVVYEYVAAFNYNPKNIKGKGSGLFLHCSRPNRDHTFGCIGVKEKYMKQLMQVIDEKTVIIIDKTSNIKKY